MQFQMGVNAKYVHNYHFLEWGEICRIFTVHLNLIFGLHNGDVK